MTDYLALEVGTSTIGYQSLFDWAGEWRVGFVRRSRCGRTQIVRPTGISAVATRAT